MPVGGHPLGPPISSSQSGLAQRRTVIYITKLSSTYAILARTYPKQTYKHTRLGARLLALSSMQEMVGDRPKFTSQWGGHCATGLRSRRIGAKEATHV